jgi:nitrite reductase/ring-hydroxylating ferredoxin subunit
MKDIASFAIAGPLNQHLGGDSAEIDSTRRDFLCKTSCIVLGLSAACGISPLNALAFPIVATSAETAQRDERFYPLPSSDGASIDQENSVILARFANRIYAFSLACPHQNTALHWLAQDQRFQCPRHQAKYQPDGTYMSGRHTRNMDRFALHLEDQKIVVDLSRLYHSDQDKADWDAAVVVLE